MSTTPTLIKVFEKITEGRRPYCFLCFSTDKETRLKNPKAIFKSITNLGVENNLYEQSPSICFMCERIAMVAVRFNTATSYAASINTMFKGMLKSQSYRDEVRMYLERTIPEHQKDNLRYETLVGCEYQLNSFRRRSRLNRSRITAVSTSDVVINETNKMEINDVPYSPKGTFKIQRKKSEQQWPEIHKPDSDDVIILDDVETSPTKKQKNNEPAVITKIHNTPRMLFKIPSQLVPRSKRVNTIQMRMLGPNGQMGARDSDVTVPPLVPIENLAPSETVVVDKAKNIVGYIHPILSANIINTVPIKTFINGATLTQTVKTGNVQHDKTEVNVQSERSAKTCLLVTKLDGKISLVPPEGVVNNNFGCKNGIEDTLGNVGNVKGKLANLGNMVGPTLAVKQPVLKNDRIDWEDKIPMDVISFVDATDSHPPSYMASEQPAMGISNVRSLRKGPPPNTGQKVEVIDLC